MANKKDSSNNKQEASAANTEEANSANFELRKIYLKDASVESPNSPSIFLANNDAPQVSIDASIRARGLEQENYYEVILSITVTSKIAEQTAFLIEVHQAGIFQISGVDEQDMPLALQIACPNILLPFAREAISDLVTKSGFPQLLLSPINFEGLYQQKLAHQQENNADNNATDRDTTTH